MAIIFTSNDIKFRLKSTRKIKNWIKAIIESYNKNTGSINYIFCSDDYILEINRQYLKHDYYTDIITFDYSEGKKLAGDIFISIQTVESNSIKFNTAFEHELMRVIIHGVLHLSGLEDKKRKEKELMRSAEDSALEFLFKQIK